MMVVSLIGSIPSYCYSHYLNPNQLLFTRPSQFPISINNNTSTSSCSRRRRKPISLYFHTQDNSSHYKTPNSQSQNTLLYYLTKTIFLFKNNKEERNQTPEEESGDKRVIKEQEDLGFLKMWWTNLKAMLGQRLNIEGITSFVNVVTKDRNLGIPHITVEDIRWIDWGEMKRRGFKGVVFDKDNTLTLPYSLSLWSPLTTSLDQCRSVFGDNVAVFSNSAGLRQFDADGTKARAVEESIGVHVLRHSVKKPAGDAKEIEKYFGCGTSQLLMVGDRHFTDVVYGNRNGFLTILTKPLSLVDEPFIVKQVRKLEAYLVNCWYQKGLKPNNHNLLQEALQCMKRP
ncbi:hypothetical protein MKW94_000675 [Papaver nudicaule]|uniref:Haloacid dehalogenase superfamily protein n=1 Tax=Papaver nudicaule TaxID=74823 RepID=A0AA41RYF9_PAPNU|nr:hypothetical protein [Papaver nudicaule]